MSEKFGGDTGTDADHGTKTESFYVDFECWIIEAVTMEDASKIASKRIEAGECPKISNVEHCELKKCSACGQNTEYWDISLKCPRCSEKKYPREPQPTSQL